MRKLGRAEHYLKRRQRKTTKIEVSVYRIIIHRNMTIYSEHEL